MFGNLQEQRRLAAEEEARRIAEEERAALEAKRQARREREVGFDPRGLIVSKFRFQMRRLE